MLQKIDLFTPFLNDRRLRKHHFAARNPIEMKLLELELNDIANCPHAHLDFQFDSISTFLIRGEFKSDVLQLALELVCTTKYDSFEKLGSIYPRIRNGKIRIKFILPLPEIEGGTTNGAVDSSDSEAPCTSREARERAFRRNQSRAKEQKDNFTLVTATRDFYSNPHVISYAEGDGEVKTCSADVFHSRFFNCTDIIFPRLADLQNGDCVDGRWMDIISLDFVGGRMKLKDYIVQFCELYAKRKVEIQHELGSITTAALKGRSSVNKNRIVSFVYILQDIRCIFEYISCSTYTVWFLLPTNYGHLQDIKEINDVGDISENNINFNLIRTQLQLIGSNTSHKFPWTEAEIYIKQLFLVAVQLAFGYHFRQNLIFLHDLEELAIHQNFEYFKAAFKLSRRGCPQVIGKNYIKRIIDVCLKSGLTCILDYRGGEIFDVEKVVVIECKKVEDCTYYTKIPWSLPMQFNANEIANYIRRATEEAKEGNQ